MRKVGSKNRGEAQRRGELLDTAAACFLARGFYATTIDEIADAHGSTKGLVYYHFKSKAELFFEVYRLAITGAMDRVRPIANGDGTGAERLWDMSREHLLDLMERLPYHNVSRQGLELYKMGALTPAENKMLEELLQLRHEYEKIFIDVVRAGVGDGSLACEDVSLGTKIFLGTLTGVAVWYKPRKTKTRENQDQLATFIATQAVRELARGKSVQGLGRRQREVA